MLRTKQQYAVGWIDSSIHAFLEDIETPPASMQYALITCLDSSFDLPPLVRSSSALQHLRPKIQFVGKGLMIKTAQLLSSERQHRLFFGFDELWFFAKPVFDPKPKDICITGPATLPEQVPEKLTRWMVRNKCSLGLGDGTGLNFVAKLQGIAKHLVQHWAHAENHEPS